MDGDDMGDFSHLSVSGSNSEAIASMTSILPGQYVVVDRGLLELHSYLRPGSLL